MARRYAGHTVAELRELNTNMTSGDWFTVPMCSAAVASVNALGPLLDRVEELEKALVGAYRTTPTKIPDHACLQCMNERGLSREIVKPGFTCWHHIARALLADDEGKGGE